MSPNRLKHLSALLLGLILGLGAAAALAQSPEREFSRAYEMAVKGDAKGALPLFESLLKRHPDDPDLLYNAGSTALLAGRLGPGVLYLERALLLDPTCADCRANLERARERQADRVVLNPGDKVLKTSAVDSLMDSLSADFLSKVMIVLSLAVGLLYLWRAFSKRPTRRFALVLILGFGIFLEAGVGSLLWLKLKVYETQRYGVVMPAELVVRKGPNPNYPEAFKVHEGLKVKLGENFDDYVQIVLGNGLNGYVEKRSLSEI